MKPTKQQIQMIFLAVVIVGGGGWFYWAKLYTPVAKEVKVHKEDLARKRSDLDRLRYIPDELKKVKADLEEKKLELEGVQGMLPKEKEIPSLLEAITLTAQANNIDFLSFTPQDIRAGEIYDEVPIAITLKANYHNLGRFLNEIGRLHRIVVPSIESLTGQEPTKEDPYTLSVSLTLSTYVYKK